AREAGDIHTQSSASSTRAWALDRLSRREDAVTACVAAAHLAEEAGDKDGAATDLVMQGHLPVPLRRYEEAREAAGAAADMLRVVGDRPTERDAVMLQAHSLLGSGNFAAAAPAARTAVGIARAVGERRELEWSLAYDLHCAAAQGESRVVDIF